MKPDRGYRVVPFDLNRRMVAASATVGRGYNTIHAFTEVDVSVPRRLIAEHRARTGERLSLTAYVVACLARAIAEHPGCNALRSGGRLYLLDEVTISVLVERVIDGRQVPEPLVIRGADRLPYPQIHAALRAAQAPTTAPLGGLSGMAWLPRLIPPALFTAFVRIAARSVGMARRYGVVGVTATGMFGPSPLWMLPLSSATVTVAIGSIVERPVWVDGRVEPREHLCLTLSFNHDIVDGAPAARFTRRLAELLAGGEMVAGAARVGGGKEL